MSLPALASLSGTGVQRSSNRHAWDYRRAAAALGPPVCPIIDIHLHLNHEEACRVFDQVRRLYGIERVYTMTQLAQCAAVRDTLGDAVRFTAFPSFFNPDRYSAFRDGYIRTIERFRFDFNSRMLKLWASPRLKEIIPETQGLPHGATDLCEVDSRWRIRACEVAQDLGMMILIHIADPDAYFATKYRRAGIFGPKIDHYHALERMLDRFPVPWLAAHMGGWPENLDFLDGLLSRHPNLHLDTSATKWVVRELSAHGPVKTHAFFTKWSGRLLFGSDIVVQADQLTPQKSGMSPMGDLADSPESAFDLYASRYWALRALFETDIDMESPITDPDLALADPDRFRATSAPRLRGMKLSPDILRILYRTAAEQVVEPWWARP